ncbi:hypothetical protein KAR52_02960 [Candidatus Pacearchaeota archaeon]|nr:hypothetical protein [Candidatus Pacearchaeota archaeon]
MEKFKGTLEAFWETGTEGVWWMLYDYDDKGYNSLHTLDKGDYLKVYQNKDKKKIHWEGKICEDREINLEKISGGYPYPRQVISNYYVHWLQKECDSKFWADMFFNEMHAELEKKK